MADIKMLITALIIVPFILLISATVFQNFAFGSRSGFEGSEIVNETLGTGAGTYYTAYPAKVDSATIYNGTALCGDACTIDYYTGLQKAKVVAGDTATGQINITYTPYSATGYTSWTKIFSQTFAGMKLGGLVPFVLIAVVIITVIVGALKIF